MTNPRLTLEDTCDEPGLNQGYIMKIAELMLRT